MRRFLAIAPLLLPACGPDQPDPCVPMCAAAARLYGECLDEWGAEWTDAGYRDQADFVDACDTWAWSARLLEDDAGETGRVDATCRTRSKAFSGGTCDDFTAVDWSRMPWSPESGAGDTGTAGP